MKRTTHKARVKYFKEYGNLKDGYAVQIKTEPNLPDNDPDAWGLDTFYSCQGGGENELVSYRILTKIADLLLMGYDVKILNAPTVRP